ncbi:MAG: hypothetical protein HOP33_13750 [Verrucomicrobia bacterium]|nr:hypothetical protein [Verrucomicrobiota bacterium]
MSRGKTNVAMKSMARKPEHKCLDGSAHSGLRRTHGRIGWLGHLNGYEQPGPVCFHNIRIKSLP